MRTFPNGFWKGGAALAALLLLVGCHGVASRAPLGQPGESVDRAKFEGVWEGLEEWPCVVKFVEDGIGRVACVDWSDGDFVLNRGEIIPAETKPRHNIVSWRGQEKPGKWDKKWYFAGYTFSGPDLVLWLPDYFAFLDANESGQLQATHEGDDLVIKDPPEDILQFMKSQNRDWFEYTEPIVLRKLNPLCRDNESKAPAEESRTPDSGKDQSSQDPPS